MDSFKYYLAIDIGASSGRHILAHLEDGRMALEEVHRFPNGMVEKDGENVWDVDELFAQIKLGMKKCGESGKIPVSVGVDTWGVDFVLLDKAGRRIGNAVAYRDGRTKGMDEEVYKIISEDALYARTGIQKAIFNTIYQLMALKVKKPEQLAEAETMLLMPDYFHYMLSGVAAAEYTEATTGQLVSPETRDWDMELIRKLGYPEKIFQKMVTPGTVLGELTPEVQEEVGYNCKVVEPATHDTGSAVIAVPTASDDALYISSGTWSLMGTELMEANCSPESKASNLTNEGGYDYRFRFLKNIMGLWMIQSVKKEIGGELGFGEICDMASECTISSIVDCNDDRFLAPANMTEEVREACRESGQQVPEGLAEVASVIYNSLAQCYAKTIRQLEGITGKKYDCIHIVGGGSNADYLNRLTAKATGVPVYAGPTEATAIGNIAAQMMSAGELAGLKAARACVFESFPVSQYQP
ncbi:rhamnulokinase [Acetatifactor aquisgranensis]|uniref:rhamnulokinase n=1 Tax=Acetatifactor aquisgranensis TaxID=2941233 RepID=UPI002041353D|nr:rhamnulokinase [Acetatifactor aquisgranensis]MCI8543030.1 rhamnulokinase [Lachnospiraceae bacterium]